MKLFSLARYALGVAVGVALLAGCSANGSTPSLGNSVAPQSVGGGHSFHDLNKMWAMTNSAHKGLPATRHPLAKSWHIKPPPGTSGTLWATDIDYASADEIAYPSGTLVGQVSGFSYPYGDCSDKSGNVYVADFSNEVLYEISGGVVVNSFPTGGESIGCSVSNTNGDVSVTNFYPGGVKIVAGPDAGASYPGPGYDWPAGYDKNGNLFVECNYVSPCSSPHLAELVSGSWMFLNFNHSINFPAAVQNYGKKFIGVADQAYPTDQTGIWLTKVSGSNATASKAVVMGSSGCSTYMDDSSSWGEIGKKPNGIGPKKVKGLAAANLWCFPSPVNTYGKNGGSPTNQWVVLPYQYDYGVTFTSP